MVGFPSLPPGKSRSERTRVLYSTEEPAEDSTKTGEGRTGETAESAADAEAYIFYSDRLPRQRQVFYQLCDLRDDRLQEIVHSNDGAETECNVSLCSVLIPIPRVLGVHFHNTWDAWWSFLYHIQ